MSTSSSDNVLNDSILESTKKLLGVHEEDPAFDQDVAIHINTALGSLTQIGVGPNEGFLISGKAETWSDFLGTGNLAVLHSVKSYVYILVRSLFDPPGASNHLNALDSVKQELEWRISVQQNVSTYPEGGIP